MSLLQHSLDDSGLVAILERGDASAELQRFVAQELKKGTFAARKTLDERWSTAKFLWQAVYVPRIKRLLAERDGPKSGIEEKALHYAVLMCIGEPRSEGRINREIRKLAGHLRRPVSRRL